MITANPEDTLAPADEKTSEDMQETSSTPVLHETALSAEAMADPKLYGLAQAILLAKAEIAKGRLFDAELGEALRRENERGAGNCLPRVRRLIDVLAAIGGDQWVVTLREPLMAVKDGHVRSQVTLIVGRATKNVSWVSRRVFDPDPRVQASAIESLWGCDDPELKEILDSATESPHHRVAANALVGLYRMNEVSSIPRLVGMAGHPDSAFRESACWAMAETGDPRFIPFLTGIFLGGDSGCMGMAVQSLKRLRARLNPSDPPGQLRLHVWDARVLPAGGRRIVFSVLRERDEESVTLAPTEVTIMEGARLVTAYTVKPRPEPERLIVGFSVPRILPGDDPYRQATESALAACAPIKRKGDLWSLNRYLAGGAVGVEQHASLVIAPEDVALTNHLRLNHGLVSDTEMIAKLIPGPGQRDKASADTAASIRRLMDALARAAGVRHLFVFLDPENSLSQDELGILAQEAEDSGVCIHGVAPDEIGKHAGFQALCQVTGGSFRILSPAQIATQFPLDYQAMRNQFMLAYRTGAANGKRRLIEIRVNVSQGRGEVAVEMG